MSKTALNFHQHARCVRAVIQDVEADKFSKQELLDELNELLESLEYSQKVEHSKRRCLQKRDQILYLCMKMYGVRDNIQFTNKGERLRPLAFLQKQYSDWELHNAYNKYKELCGEK